MSDDLSDSKTMTLRARRRGAKFVIALLLFAPLSGGSGAAQSGPPSAGRITYAELGTGLDADQRLVNASTSFAPDTAEIVCVWRVEGVPSGGGTIRFVWVAEDTGGVAPPNYAILEKSLALARPGPRGPSQENPLCASKTSPPKPTAASC
jgi:hypothetical protein